MQEKTIKSFVVDTNLFVAAVKPFSRPSPRSRSGDKNALSLLIKLIVNEEFELKGNSILIEEYRRFAKELDSETSRLILKQLVERVTVEETKDDLLVRCKPYFSATESADVVHAATCLQTDAILITNDAGF